MKKPVLVIMAAGMGSRYGGLKQIDPVDGEMCIRDRVRITDKEIPPDCLNRHNNGAFPALLLALRPFYIPSDVFAIDGNKLHLY